MCVKNIVFKSTLVAVLLAFSPAVLPFGEAGPFESAAHDGTVFYQHSGLKLFFPREYDALLRTETPRKTGDGILFAVSEEASIAAAKALGSSAEGAGWIFSIGWVDEPGFHELLCKDMSGMEIFAKDDLGNRYIFYHPTDVRYVRKDNAAMTRDQRQWTQLNQWVWENVRNDFILDNLGLGLTAETFDNSVVAMYLARAAYQPKTKYTLSTTQYGPLSSDDVKAAPYAERLIRNAEYRMVDISETPAGEYVVLNFPKENIRFDFFKMPGSENYVREVHADGTEILYRATFADGVTKASTVMQRWYNDLASRR